MRLSIRQREALGLLQRCAGHDDGWGAVFGDASTSFDGQAWINWQTAEALEARGLVEINREWDGWNVRLLLGKAAAA